jgi:hypothetical protein
VVSSFSVTFMINWNLPHFEIFKLLW